MGLCSVGAKEVQQIRECHSLDVSKDHSDPYWTGQISKLPATRVELRQRDRSSQVADWKYAGEKRVKVVCSNSKGFIISAKSDKPQFTMGLRDAWTET